VFAAPNVDAILRMAATSAVIGVVVHVVVSALRALWRTTNPAVRAAPLLLAALLFACRFLPEHLP